MRRPLYYAVLVHLILFLFIFISIRPPKKVARLTKTDAKTIVKAVAVSNEQLTKEIARIKTIQQQQRRLADEKKQQEMAQLRAIENKRKAVEKQMTDMRKQADQLKQKQLQEKQRLAQLQAQHKRSKLEQEKIVKKLEAAKKEELRKLAAKELEASIKEEERQASIAGRQKKEIDQYKALIVQSIAQHWLVPDASNKVISCQLLIRLAPGGSVLDVRMVRSSGDPVLDRSAQMAVYKASPLPVPKDSDLFNKFRELNLTVRPETVLNRG